MQLNEIIDNEPAIAEAQFYDGESFEHLKQIGRAIGNTVDNWDVVLSLIVGVVVILGSIIVFLCSIKKIFRFQADMESKAREKIRNKKILKHSNLILLTQKSFEDETHEIDTHVEDQIYSNPDLYDIPKNIRNEKEPSTSNVDDNVFEQWPEPQKTDNGNHEIVEIEMDYSAIDVPDTSDTWPDPPEPISNLNYTNS